MLTLLSIRDVVLIERLDLSLAAGLTVLTGETGAGKSILLDSLGLALGDRAASGLVRAGAEQASVSACFDTAPGHPVRALLAAQGIAAEDDSGEPIVLRRVVTRDGRSRAYVNDQPVGVGLLRQAGALLVEIQGQHDQMGLADPATHLDLLDGYGVPATLRRSAAENFRGWREATQRLSAARAAIAEAAREEDWLRQSVEDLSALAPQEGEEEQLAGTRQSLQQGERRAEAIAAALAEIAPRDRRHGGPAAALRAATRALQRLLPSPAMAVAGDAPDAPDPAPDSVAGRTAAAMAALERAEEALSDAEGLLGRLSLDAEADPRLLEQTEERLFALRAAARKHGVAVVELPGLLAGFRTRLSALDSGASEVEALDRAARDAHALFVQAAEALSGERAKAAKRLEKAIMAELAPLRLERARFSVALQRLAEAGWSARGADAAGFMIATNPGEPPGPIGKVASGGELSRLMLALKVVLASASTVPTLVFDEVDSGVGGATAASVGERLAKVAHDVQTLVVTHSPQVAARGDHHLRIAKRVASGRTQTHAEPLDGNARREEIARMLAGETVTEAARAAADSLLGQATLL